MRNHTRRSPAASNAVWDLRSSPVDWALEVPRGVRPARDLKRVQPSFAAVDSLQPAALGAKHITARALQSRQLAIHCRYEPVLIAVLALRTRGTSRNAQSRSRSMIQCSARFLRASP